MKTPQRAARKRRRSSQTSGNQSDDEGCDSGAGNDEWRASGSAYLGRVVRRSIFDDAGALVGFSHGTVRGWLDAHESDFSDERGAPAETRRNDFLSPRA